ncbi:hypothetical protein UlMin_042649 [Ulmus minor]
MEEVREFKHGCKFCRKSFPCGRSLGGHMRSHLINNSTEAEEKLSRSKLPSLNNGGLSKVIKAKTSFEAAPPPGYGLRENPKKTWRISYSSEETSCLCKECGKAFQSWKALFGHMKCHSKKEGGCSINNNFSEEEQDSWSSDQEKELVFDSNSDNETIRRSQRRTRYLGAAANSSSFSNLANGSSISKIEQKQEEVAMCLMMLSRDVTNWVASKSAVESSDNFLEFSKSKKLNPKTPENCKLDGKKPENYVPGFSKLWSRIDRAKVSIGGFLKKDKILDSKAKLAKESDFGEFSSKKYNPKSVTRGRVRLEEVGRGEGRRKKKIKREKKKRKRKV